MGGHFVLLSTDLLIDLMWELSSVADHVSSFVSHWECFPTTTADSSVDLCSKFLVRQILNDQLGSHPDVNADSAQKRCWAETFEVILHQNGVGQMVKRFLRIEDWKHFCICAFSCFDVLTTPQEESAKCAMKNSTRSCFVTHGRKSVENVSEFFSL